MLVLSFVPMITVYIMDSKMNRISPIFVIVLKDQTYSLDGIETMQTQIMDPGHFHLTKLCLPRYPAIFV
jgi:hypothetical protein